jgi:hypothetical protein
MNNLKATKIDLSQAFNEVDTKLRNAKLSLKYTLPYMNITSEKLKHDSYTSLVVP